MQIVNFNLILFFNTMSSTRINLRILILVCLIFTVGKVRSQFWAGIGYSGAAPLATKNLNYVIDRYNQTRPWLTNAMQKFNYFDGLTFRVGVWNQKHFYDIGYTGGSQRVSSLGSPPPNGVEKRRDLKASFNSWNFSFGKSINSQEKNNIALGISINYGRIRVKTRYDSPEDIKRADYGDIIKKGMATVGFFGRWMIADPGFTIEPFINFSVIGSGKADAYDVNKRINPDTYTADPSSLKFRASTVGLKVMVSVTTRK